MSAGVGTFGDGFSFQLREGGDDTEYESSARRAGVDVLLQGLETGKGKYSMNVTDLLGNTPEQTIEPLSGLGWFGWGFLALLLLALCAFLALVLQQSYNKGVWITGVIAGWIISGAISPLYRAVGPGRTQQWWWVTLILFALIIVFYVAPLLMGADLLNLVMGLLAPTGGVVTAIIHDSMTEQLASFPMAWTTFIILMGIICVVLFVSSLSSRN
ncbi:hypothetical protein AB0O14_19655 [Microbacterium foliorum]